MGCVAYPKAWIMAAWQFCPSLCWATLGVPQACRFSVTGHAQIPGYAHLVSQTGTASISVSGAALHFPFRFSVKHQVVFGGSVDQWTICLYWSKLHEKQKSALAVAYLHYHYAAYELKMCPASLDSHRDRFKSIQMQDT